LKSSNEEIIKTFAQRKPDREFWKLVKERDQLVAEAVKFGVGQRDDLDKKIAEKQMEIDKAFLKMDFEEAM